MKKFTLSSPAKINLFLHIVGRRPDGYHNLQSVFAILNKGDKLTFEERMDDKIEILPDLGFNVEDNIVYKAIMLLRKETSISKGITITIEKNIPMGGGLGGGSSNAATTLLALNKLWNLNLTTKRLCELGKTLGADVPIFVNDNNFKPRPKLNFIMAFDHDEAGDKAGKELEKFLLLIKLKKNII